MAVRDTSEYLDTIRKGGFRHQMFHTQKGVTMEDKKLMQNPEEAIPISDEELGDVSAGMNLQAATLVYNCVDKSTEKKKKDTEKDDAVPAFPDVARFF